MRRKQVYSTYILIFTWKSEVLSSPLHHILERSLEVAKKTLGRPALREPMDGRTRSMTRFDGCSFSKNVVECCLYLYDMKKIHHSAVSDLPAYLTLLYLYNYPFRQPYVLAASLVIGVHWHRVHLVTLCTSPHRARKPGRLASA